MDQQQYYRVRRQLGWQTLAAACAFATIATFSAASAAQSAATDVWASLADAVTSGAPWLNLRYRFEQVDQGGPIRNTQANTIRTRLGYATGQWRGLSLLLELENNTHIGQDQFNDGSDPVSDRAVIVDPDSTEVNQAALRVSAPQRTEIIAGRHRVVLDNERFFGDANFRQNQQTFDGVTLVNLALPRLEVHYDYLSGAQRSLGSDSTRGSFNTDINILHATFRALPALAASAYGYFVEVDDDPRLSSRTIGARVTGEYLVLKNLRATYTAEVARQSDFGDNSASFALNYYRIEPGLTSGDASISIGVEVLESDGTNAVQTPFATLHKFQGFADVFTTTPTSGIEDRFVAFAYKKTRIAKLDSVRVWGAYHQFKAEQSNVRYGSEIDAAIAISFLHHYRVTAKYADYDARRFATNTERFWLILELSF